MTHKIAKVCCDRLMLAHSANFIKLLLWWLVKNIFGEAILRPSHLLRLGQLPPPLPPYIHADGQCVCDSES